MAGLPTDISAIAFACPRCRTSLEPLGPGALRCPADGLVFPCLDGIWRMLLPEREAHFSRFILEYETIRRAEGRGSNSPDYYRALPYGDAERRGGRMAADWRIRAASFDALVNDILIPMEQRISASPRHRVSPSPRLRVLDLGAGNGWLSNRLAARGYAVAAVDLMTNDFDGLGCHRFYESRFIPVQAEFDRLPFVERSADLLIFNASLHYSTGYEQTLREALRVVAPNGKLVVLDTPVYQDPKSGAQMVREREAQFSRQYGFPSNALPGENYLTYRRLNDLAAALHCDLQILTPFYGIGWQLRPLKARLAGSREPAKFHLVVLSPHGH